MPTGYRRTEFQRSEHQRVEAIVVRSTARRVCTSDLRRDAAARTAGGGRRLDMGARARAVDGTRPGSSESLHWIAVYERAESAASLPETLRVYVADRKADILNLMQRAHTMGNPAEWLIRVRHARC